MCLADIASLNSFIRCSAFLRRHKDLSNYFQAWFFLTLTPTLPALLMRSNFGRNTVANLTPSPTYYSQFYQLPNSSTPFL